MCFKLSQQFTVIFLFYYMLLFNILCLRISVYATSYSSSDEIKNIFSSHNTKSVLQETHATGNFAEGGLVNASFTLSKSKASSKNAAKNISNNHDNAFPFKDFSIKKNVSLFSNNENINKNYNSHQDFSINSTLLPSKLIETGSNLFLGVPEVIHINGTSSIKPRKGVHFSKIVPPKGVDSENEAFHVSLENESCFWISEKECYSNKGIQCRCCKKDNFMGKNVKQTPVPCKVCKTFKKLSSEGYETCKNICCDAISNNFDSVTSSENNYSNHLNNQAVSSTEKVDHNTRIYSVISKSDSSSVIDKKENKNLSSFGKYSKLKPLITKVPYDAENITNLLGKVEEKVVIPLAVSLFLLPLLGIIIFFLWHRTKEYWNKRYYKRMDFLIDGIYND